MAPVGVGIPRPKALTTPAVKVFDNPYELPIANTDWPTFKSLDVPIWRKDQIVSGPQSQ